MVKARKSDRVLEEKGEGDRWYGKIDKTIFIFLFLNTCGQNTLLVTSRLRKRKVTNVKYGRQQT